MHLPFPELRILVDIQLKSLENTPVASPAEAIGRRSRGDTCILTVVLPGAVMSPKHFAEHRGQEGRHGTHRLGYSVTGRIQQTQEIAGFSGKYVGVEVHHVVGQGGADERVHTLIVEPRSAIAAHVSRSNSVKGTSNDRQIGMKPMLDWSCSRSLE